VWHSPSPSRSSTCGGRSVQAGRAGDRVWRRPPSTGGGIRNVGIVRFNPYHDTGGDYSFAVALLDGSGTGVLLTGLYHRDQCRVYAKPISGWGSSYALTGEEREAIERSRGEDESETAGADRL